MPDGYMGMMTMSADKGDKTRHKPPQRSGAAPFDEIRRGNAMDPTERVDHVASDQHLQDGNR